MSNEVEISQHPAESSLSMEMEISIEGYHVAVTMTAIPDDETFDYLLKRMAYAKRYLHNAYFMDTPVGVEVTAIQDGSHHGDEGDDD